MRKDYSVKLFLTLIVCFLISNVSIAGKVEYRPLTRDEAIRDYVSQHFIADLENKTDFPRDEIAKLFTDVFTTIKKEFILEVTYDELLTRSLEALKFYIGKLNMTVVTERLLVHKGMDLVGTFPVPEAENPESYGRLLAVILDHSRKFSDDLDNAHPEEIYYVVFSYIMQSLDKNSSYIYPEKAKRLRTGYSISKSLGFTYRRVKDGIQVLSLVDNSPAFLAGMEEGDLVTHLYNKLVKDLKYEEIERILYSNDTNIVPVGYFSYNTQKFSEIYIRNATITPDSTLIEEDANNRIVYITINSFVKGTASLLESKIRKLKAKYKTHGIRGLVIDLRGNNGGLIDEALEVTNIFVDGGKILETNARVEKSNKKYTASEGDLLKDIPVVILADQTTKSSAEIFAAILQDRKRAFVIGSPTYGKGTIQKTIELANGAMLKVSHAEAFSPIDAKINEVGVFPLVCTSSILDQSDLDRFVDNVRYDEFRNDYKNMKIFKGDSDNDEIIPLMREACKGIYPNTKYVTFLRDIAKMIILKDKIHSKLLKMIPEKDEFVVKE